ncbi:hypothetical protein BDZ89DRAFT_1134759 [Hymenopellis radicata]|nr:hypothetical protein BDZ89DRAFT_1134759 [Hymenopellis radicata]
MAAISAAAVAKEYRVLPHLDYHTVSTINGWAALQHLVHPQILISPGDPWEGIGTNTPDAPGRYLGYWRLKNSIFHLFGTSIWME